MTCHFERPNETTKHEMQLERRRKWQGCQVLRNLKGHVLKIKWPKRMVQYIENFFINSLTEIFFKTGLNRNYFLQYSKKANGQTISFLAKSFSKGPNGNPAKWGSLKAFSSEKLKIDDEMHFALTITWTRAKKYSRRNYFSDQMIYAFLSSFFSKIWPSDKVQCHVHWN